MRDAIKISGSTAVRAGELQTNSFGVSAGERLRSEFLEHGVGPPHLSQRVRVAASREREQPLVLRGLGALRQQFPIHRDSGGKLVDSAKVSQEQQRRFRSPADQVAEALLNCR